MKIQFLTIFLAFACFLGDVVSVNDKEIVVCNVSNQTLTSSFTYMMFLCFITYLFIQIPGLVQPDGPTAAAAKGGKQGTYRVDVV